MGSLFRGAICSQWTLKIVVISGTQNPFSVNKPFSAKPIILHCIQAREHHIRAVLGSESFWPPFHRALTENVLSFWGPPKSCPTTAQNQKLYGFGRLATRWFPRCFQIFCNYFGSKVRALWLQMSPFENTPKIYGASTVKGEVRVRRQWVRAK